MRKKQGVCYTSNLEKEDKIVRSRYPLSTNAIVDYGVHNENRTLVIQCISHEPHLLLMYSVLYRYLISWNLHADNGTVYPILTSYIHWYESFSIGLLHHHLLKGWFVMSQDFATINHIWLNGGERTVPQTEHGTYTMLTANTNTPSVILHLFLLPAA